jgi:hypothetical protein
MGLSVTRETTMRDVDSKHRVFISYHYAKRDIWSVFTDLP